MTKQFMNRFTNIRQIKQLGQRWQVRILLALSLLWLTPTLACGSFAPRPTPTPTPVLAAPILETPTIDPNSATVETAPPVPVVETPTNTPIPTPTPAVQTSTGLAAGQPALVTAPNGLNLRDNASPSGALLIQLTTNQRVTVVEGPVEAEGFTWWKVDDGAGRVGWVAQGDAETVWLTPQSGGAQVSAPVSSNPQPVNRAPQVGERVLVTMPAGGQLSVRTAPGIQATLVTRVNPGAQFTVLAGPQQANGFVWYQVRSDDGSVEGWAADGDAGVRWLSPLQ
jgi:hypothetical protein